MLTAVTRTGPTVSLRVPLLLRCWAVAFPVVAVGSVLAVVTARQRVDAFPDGRLVVRNRFSSRSLTRDDVEDVAAGTHGGGPLPNWRVELVLADGSAHPLTVTERPALPGVRARVERDAARLREWLTGRPAPFL